VLEAVAATQLKKILTLIMCQPLIFIGEISPKREIYNLKIWKRHDFGGFQSSKVREKN
jgi:hypothetical protein